MSDPAPILGQAMPRMRVDLPVVKVSNASWPEAKRRFKRVRKIVCGAFGCAYTAVLDKHKVIVKVAGGMPRIVDPKEAFEALHREIVILGRLQKFPFVPRLVEVGPDYFVQEDVGGESFDYLLRYRGLEAREILSVAIAAGVMASHIHKEGVAHRDLHEGNLLLSPQGVVIIDFGLAVERKESENLFKEGIKADFLSVIHIVMLATNGDDLPASVRAVLTAVATKFQAKVDEGTVNEDSCEELAKELFFVAAQLGARAMRGHKTLKTKKIRHAAI